MKGLSKLTAHLNKFVDERKKGISITPAKRKEYADAIANCFYPCAQAILAGHFEVRINKLVRIIYPTAIELYYHEEEKGGFKDPIMYHTDDRKRADYPDYFILRGINSLPYFPIGSLNPHTSGVDVTFENPDKKYRASFLIREYRVKYESGIEIPVKNSTEIYDDLLVYGIPQDDDDRVEWCDGNALLQDQIERIWRRNVPDYTEVSPGRWRKNDQIEGKDSFSSGGVKYVKCPFRWQFRVKK